MFNTKDFTFNNFIVSACNEEAYNTCVSMIDDTKGRFVVLCGPSGCGKTHLLTAIQNAYKLKYPEKSVLVMSANELIERYIDSFEHQKTAEYVDMICSQDLIVIDNMQFMAGKLSIQKETAKWFCKMISNGKKVMVALDILTENIGGAFGIIAEQHSERCQIAEIKRADIELRKKQLERLSEELQIKVPKSISAIMVNSEQIAFCSFAGIFQKFLMFRSQLNRNLTKEEMLNCIFDYF